MPSAVSAAATAVSHDERGGAEVAAGELRDVLERGEVEHPVAAGSSSGPSTVRRKQAPSTPHAAATARGASPKIATAAPTSTHTAGTGARPAASSRGSCPASSLLIASARPAPSPFAPSTITLPPIATAT